MKKLIQKWCIIVLLEDVEEGHEFDKGEWPLHITLAGVHTVDWHSKILVSDFSQLSNTVKPFGVRTVDQGNLGPENDPIKVIFIEKSPLLMKLHGQIINFLESNHAIFNNPEWNHEGYIPHSTIQRHSRIQANKKMVIVDNLTLVDMYPNKNNHRRKVVRTFKL